MRKAFTAIELMIVVAILMLLIGILVPVVSGMRERAKIRLAKSRLRTVALAIDQFRLSKGRYPQGDTDGDPTLIYESLKDDFMEFGVNEIEGDGSPGTIAIDPWGNGWKYREHFSAFDKRLSETDYNQLKTTRAAHNPGSFDLWSMGPDGNEEPWMHDLSDNDNNGKIDEYEEKSAAGATNDDDIGDDICNW